MSDKKSLLGRLQQFKYAKGSSSTSETVSQESIVDSDIVPETPPSSSPDESSISVPKQKSRKLHELSDSESEYNGTTCHLSESEHEAVSELAGQGNGANGKTASSREHVISDSESEDDNSRNKLSRKHSTDDSTSDSQSESRLRAKSNNPKRKRRRLASSDGEEYTCIESEQSSSEEENVQNDRFTKEKAFKYVKSKFPKEDIMVIQDVLIKTSYNVEKSLKELTKRRDEQINGATPKAKFSRVKRKNADSESEISGSESDANDLAVGETSDIYDSDDEMVDDTLTPARQQVIDFLQNATPEELQHVPKCGSKKVDAIIAARPFTGWLQLVNKLKTSKFVDTELLEGALSVINMRASLKKLLDKCEVLANAISKDAGNLLDDVSGQSYMRSNKAIAPPKLLNKTMSLKPHQFLAIDWMYLLHRHDVNCILADEMGLGKTIETIGFLAYLAEKGIDGPHVVIVPSSTLDNWIREFETWFPSYKILAYTGNQKERLMLRYNICKRQVEHFDILITTYNLVTRNQKDLLLFKKYKFNYAVFDEAHMMKNAATKCYRNLMQINAKRRLLLTGTPLQNNLMELLSILMFAMPRLFKGNREQIEKMFTIALKGSTEANFYKSRIDQAKTIMKPFVLRRLKQDVLQDLPKKNCSILKCQMAPKQRQIYDELIDTFSKQQSEGGPTNPLAMMMELRKVSNHPLLLRNIYDDKAIEELALILSQDMFYQEDNKDYIQEDLSFMSDFNIHMLCKNYTACRSRCLSSDHMLSSGKFKLLDDMLPNIKEQGSKVLIFSKFTMVLDIVEEYMKIRQHRFLRLDGTTPVFQRQDLMDEFNNDKDLFIFLLSTCSGGLGINLTSANIVFLHDIDFNPFNDRQAEDRCHRVGQTKDVKVYRLISEDSIEENILERAEGKLLLEQQVSDGITDNNDPVEMTSILQSVLKPS